MRTFYLMLAFAAVATIGAAQQGTAPAKPAKPPATGVSQPTAQKERGRDPYVKYGCYQCHGYEAQGGSAGVRLGPNPIPLDDFIAYVRRPTREMPPYTEKVLSDDELKEMYAFVESRPKPPQRPALLK